MEIRGDTISYASYKKKERNNHENKLSSEILILETNLNELNKERLLLLQTELTEIRENRLNGCFVRSRSNWIDNGEKDTHFFCNLEKQLINTFLPMLF